MQSGGSISTTKATSNSMLDRFVATSEGVSFTLGPGLIDGAQHTDDVGVDLFEQQDVTPLSVSKNINDLTEAVRPLHPPTSGEQVSMIVTSFVSRIIHANLDLFGGDMTFDLREPEGLGAFRTNTLPKLGPEVSIMHKAPGRRGRSPGDPGNVPPGLFQAGTTVTTNMDGAVPTDGNNNPDELRPGR